MEKTEKTSNLSRGRWGEDRAAEYFRNKGFCIIARNLSCRIGEIDIIARDGNQLVFAEVKTRTRVDKGLPCEFIAKDKMRRIILSSQCYLKLHPELYRLQPRFDVVELACLDSGVYIRHTKNAFS